MLFKQGEASKNVTAVKEVPVPLNRTRTYLLPNETDEPETASIPPKEGNKFEELYKSGKSETLSTSNLKSRETIRTSFEHEEKSVVEESVSIYDIVEEESVVKPVEPSVLTVTGESVIEPEEPILEPEEPVIQPEEPQSNEMAVKSLIKIEENEVENKNEEVEMTLEPVKESSRTERLSSSSKNETQNRQKTEENNEEKIFPPVKENVFRVSHAKLNKKPFRRKTKPDIKENTQTESLVGLSHSQKNNILYDDKSIGNDERISAEKVVQEHYPDGVRKDVLGSQNRGPVRSSKKNLFLTFF